ncbi:SDR family oxidoreductase [Sphingomonas sp. GM_Shp_2]|uniref:SDR family NAD(P)-dependent oxidoreductase n=1 Tax=Sphingomonas sp. GM_Shp_2 TaxID=2937380 RepID=UPI00226A0AD1|nr:SDR family oxidoreductase [Sphingomonas sp. GM_Shp_2]
MSDDILSPGRVAVVTGAAVGIGAAAARHFSALGMRLCLFDRDGDALAALVHDLDRDDDVRTVIGDVTDYDALQTLSDNAYDAFGDVALLLNNAGIHDGAGPWSDLPAWRRQIDVNFFSLVAAQTIFVPRMLAQQGRSAVVNLGSKEGITTPPGNAAYSVAKAGVKVLTEQLAHELREVAGDKVTAHLFVPGYTWTPMNAALKPAGSGKPDEAWTAEQLLAHFDQRFRHGDFYILCPDNAVTPAIDAKRIRWAADDIVENRPALSRWHPDWSERFTSYMRDA